MRLKILALATVCATVLALAPGVSLAGAACCKKKAAAAATAENNSPCGSGSGCTTCAGGTAAIAAKAQSGCSKSMAQLVALAEDSGCAKTSALAAKAKAGDEEATEALIAKYSAAHHPDPETQALAANARSGCTKSTAKLVEMAKNSGCPRSWDLADRVEAGDEEAKAQLIAMYSAPSEDAAEE